MSDPITDLVVNAMGYGVMMALERREELLAKLSSLPPNTSLAEALKGDAEEFVGIRTDLVEAISGGSDQ